MKIKFLIILIICLIVKLSYSQSNYVLVDSSAIFLNNNNVVRFYHTYYGKDKIDPLKPYNDGIDSTRFDFRKLFVLDVLFDKSKSRILPKSFISLNKLAELLTDNPEFEIKISGHTDKIGDTKKNLKLSKRRAHVVKIYLKRKGIKLNRIASDGFGDKIPICESPCDKNRRVEFKLISHKKKI